MNSHNSAFTIQYSAFCKPSVCIIPFPLTQTVVARGSEFMRDKKAECGAAKMAWELFEKTGSISYYMLYYELLRKR